MGSEHRRLDLCTNAEQLHITLVLEILVRLKSSKLNKQTVTKMNEYTVHTKHRVLHHFPTRSLNVTLMLPYILRFSFVGNILNARLQASHCILIAGHLMTFFQPGHLFHIDL